jgi:hypothetical protein
MNDVFDVLGDCLLLLSYFVFFVESFCLDVM